jgi:Tfp pilus assembly protein PilW
MCAKVCDKVAARPQGGATLVETLAALFLGGMVLLGLQWVYGSALALWARSDTKMTMHADGTYALEQMAAAARQADGQTLRSGTELHLTIPASLLDANSKSEERVFLLKNEILWMDGKALVPAPGDSSIGVAALKLEETVDAAADVRVLSLGVQLFSRETPNRASDSMWFATSVHLRNRFAAAGITGTVGGTSF